MATTTAETFAKPHRETRRHPGAVQLRYPLRLVQAIRQRRADRRMLRIVQQLDHPGVLEDFEAARGSDWQ